MRGSITIRLIPAARSEFIAMTTVGRVYLGLPAFNEEIALYYQHRLDGISFKTDLSAIL